MIEQLETRRLLSGSSPSSVVGLRIYFDDYTFAVGTVPGYQLLLSAGHQYTAQTTGLNVGGTYKYRKTGASTGLLTIDVPASFLDDNPETLPLSLSFSNSKTGTYSGIATGEVGGSEHDGTFVVQSAAQGSAAGPPSLSVTAAVAPKKAKEGATASATIRVANTGTGPSSAPFNVTLYLSADGTIDASDSLVVATAKAIHLKAGASGTVKVQFVCPAMPAGSYHVIASLTDAAGTNSVAASSGTVAVASTVASLTGTLVSQIPATATTGSTVSVTMNVTNAGKIPAGGPYIVALAIAPVAADGTLGKQTGVSHVTIQNDIPHGDTQETLTFTVYVTHGNYQLVLAGGRVSNVWEWVHVLPSIISVS